MKVVRSSYATISGDIVTSDSRYPSKLEDVGCCAGWPPVIAMIGNIKNAYPFH